MLRFGSSLNNLRIMSLRVGYPIGTTTNPIINPHNLTILGFFCVSQDVPPPALIMTQSIREISGQRLITDSEDEIIHVDDMVRDREIANLNYQLVGKKVVTESKRKLGKIEDYVINSNDFVIYKIHVARTGMGALAGGKLIIDRNQIVATDDKEIVVKDGFERAPAASPSLATSV